MKEHNNKSELLTRSDFLRMMSLTSLSLLPGSNVLAGMFAGGTGPGTPAPDQFIDLAYSLQDHSNLLHLQVYFINVELSEDKKFIQQPGGSYVHSPGKEEVESHQRRVNELQSYMVVRLPQQHIEEEYKTVASAKGNFHAVTHISGYSFLAFRIYFNRIEDGTMNKKGQLAISSTSFMDWNAPHFRLWTRNRIDHNLFTIEKQEKPYPLGTNAAGKYERHAIPMINSRNVANVARGISNKELRLLAEPVTAIEAPYRLVISPHLPDQDNYYYLWRFSLPRPIKKDGYNELWMATLSVVRKEALVTEIRNINLRENIRVIGKVKKKNKKPAPFKPDPVTKAEPVNEGDNDLQLMIIGSPDYSSTGDRIAPAANFLPTAMDRSDLVKIYLLSSIHAHTPAMSFTPLGLSSYISFKNKKYDVNNIDLYEWNQQISFGRDQQVEVSRVIMEGCFGLKMLHVKTTRRETYRGTSLLVYREFVKPLEPEKDYTLYNNTDPVNINAYQDANWKCNTPFKSVKFATLQPKEILPLDELKKQAGKSHVVTTNIETRGIDRVTGAAIPADIEAVVAFWPCTPGGYELSWDFEFTDWHGNTTIQTKKLFLLKSDLGLNKNKKEKKEEKAVFQMTDALKNIEKVFSVNRVYGGQNEPAKQVFQNIKNIEAIIDGALPKLTDPATHLWERIQAVSEDTVLRKVDFLKEHLDKIIRHTEAILEKESLNIRDQVMEEWAVFKRASLNARNHIFNVFNQLEKRLGDFKEALDKVGTPEAKGLAKDIEQRIAALQGLAKQTERDINANKDIALSKIKGYKDSLTNYYNSFIQQLESIARSTSTLKERFPDIMQKITDLQQFVKITSEITDLGPLYHYQAFLQRLPQRFVAKVRRDLDALVGNYHHCVNRVQEIETSLRSRIECHKAEIGYAVLGVEDDLTKLKERLKQEIGRGWEEEYERLRKLYNDKYNKAVSAFQTEYVILKNNFRIVAEDMKKRSEDIINDTLDFFDPYAAFPQLHTAKVYLKTINDLVHQDIPVKIKYAESYIKNQISNTVLETQNNVSQVFAEIQSDARELIKGAVREVSKELGGIINPELAADYITYLKDTREDIRERVQSIVADAQDEAAAIRDRIMDQYNDVKQELEGDLNKYKDIIKQERNRLLLLTREAKERFEEARNLAEIEAREFFKGLEAKILGAIPIKDLLGKDFVLPKLDRKDNKIIYQFITDKLENVIIGPFAFGDIDTTPQGKAKLAMYFEKPLSGIGSYMAWTRISDFQIGIYDARVIVAFDKLEVISNDRVKNKISVHVRDVRFQKELAFLDALSKNMQIPGTGLTLNIKPQQIDVDFAYAVPGISGGAFIFDNLKFSIKLSVPLPLGGKTAQMPLNARFAVNEPDDKFIVAVGIYGGKGHFVLEATPGYVRKVDVGIDFGGVLQLNLGIAKGHAFLMAGIRYVYQRNDLGEVKFELYAILSCGGSVKVWGFVTISVLFQLYLRYQSFAGKSTMYGTVSVTYSVEVGFFKRSVTFTYSRRLHGSEGASQSFTFNGLDNGHDLNDDNYDETSPIYRYADAGEADDELFHTTGFGGKKKNKTSYPDLDKIYKQEEELKELLSAYKMYN